MLGLPRYADGHARAEAIIYTLVLALLQALYCETRVESYFSLSNTFLNFEL
jgi:hypothetical protein